MEERVNLNRACNKKDSVEPGALPLYAQREPEDARLRQSLSHSHRHEYSHSLCFPLLFRSSWQQLSVSFSLDYKNCGIFFLLPSQNSNFCSFSLFALLQGLVFNWVIQAGSSSPCWNFVPIKAMAETDTIAVAKSASHSSTAGTLSSLNLLSTFCLWVLLFSFNYENI